jgi:protein-disulfide isomerase
MKTHIIFGLTVVVLIFAFVVGSLYYKGKQAEKVGFLAQENVELFIREHSQTLGSDDAKVYLIEFMDPACETCAAFSPFVEQIMDANPGRIKLVIRYAPFHEGADYFVKILEAAQKQGKYWETLDTMYKTQRFWTRHHKAIPEKIWPILTQVGVDVERIRKDMNDPAIVKLIDQDLADAKVLNVRKTPGYFVNGKPLQTFGSRQLLQLVQSELNANYPN